MILARQKDCWPVVTMAIQAVTEARTDRQAYTKKGRHTETKRQSGMQKDRDVYIDTRTNFVFLMKGFTVHVKGVFKCVLTCLMIELQS